jgi:uncharacterized protein
MASPYSVLPALVAAAPLFLADWVTRYYARPRPDLPFSGRELGRQLLDRAGLHHVEIGTTLETPDKPFEGTYVATGRFVGLSSRIDADHSIAAYALAARAVGEAIRVNAGLSVYGARHQHALGRVLLAFPFLFIAGLLFVAAAPSGTRYDYLPFFVGVAGALSIVGGLLLVNIWSDLRVDFAHALPMLRSGYLGPEDLRAARRMLVMRSLSTLGVAALGLLSSVVMLLVWRSS